ncbi:MAG: hypothetical protein ACYC7D_14950 [Nitrososphaerales archaeon]
MKIDNRAVSLGASALVVIALVIIIGLGVYLNGTFNFTSSSYTSNSLTHASPPTQTTRAVTTSSNNLAFTMLLNSSTVQAGQVMGVSLNLFNTLDGTNNVTGAQNWNLTDQSEQGEPSFNCAQNDVFRIEVINGYYGFSNYSNGSPLDVLPFQPPLGFNQCLLYVRAANSSASPISDQNYGQNYYVFNPESNVAQWKTAGTYTTGCSSCDNLNQTNGGCNPCDAINQRAVMNETIILKPSLFASTAGVFTIVAGDEWGQIVILHFRVIAPFTPSLNAICLEEMPANATIENFQNSTFIGYRVSMPNGTISYFPLGGCPSPVLPKLFTAAAKIEQNINFIAAEGNYTYVVDPIGSLNAGGSVFHSGLLASSFTVVDFGYYSNQRIYPCGGSFWTLLELGRIQVDLPINPDGSYNYSNITIISSFSTSGVQMFSCTTQVTSIPAQSQTVISNETCTAAAFLNQTTTTETVTLCHSESTRTTNSTSSG